MIRRARSRFVISPASIAIGALGVASIALGVASLALGVAIAVGVTTVAHAQSPAPTTAAKPAAPLVAALAPPSTDDARSAVVIGPAGEVYEPDGKGAWIRKQRISTSKQLAHVGRAAGAVIAFGEGVVYRLAPNGWSAIRLHQKERAVMSAGVRAVAAVGRQLFALDHTAGGEPFKLALAPSNVIAIATGAATTPPTAVAPPVGGVVIQTDRGLFRVEGGARVVAVKTAPPRVSRLVSDRWVLVENGAIDLKTGRKTGWPPGVIVGAVAAMADERLVIVAKQHGKLELVTIGKDGRLDRAPIVVTVNGAAAPGTSATPSPPSPPSPPAPPAPTAPTAPTAMPSPTAMPVGVVIDRAGRAVIAFDDGTLLLRGGDDTQAGSATSSSTTWRVARISADLPVSKPGSPPAVSP